MITRGELRDCQSHHPEGIFVVVAIPLPIQAFPTKTEKQLLLPKPSKLPQDKPKAEQPVTAGRIPSAGFFLKKFKLKQAPRAANAEANAECTDRKS